MHMQVDVYVSGVIAYADVAPLIPDLLFQIFAQRMEQSMVSTIIHHQPSPLFIIPEQSMNSIFKPTHRHVIDSPSVHEYIILQGMVWVAFMNNACFKLCAIYTNSSTTATMLMSSGCRSTQCQGAWPTSTSSLALCSTSDPMTSDLTSR